MRIIIASENQIAFCLNFRLIKEISILLNHSNISHYFQQPNFGIGEDGEAMKNRIRVFKCKSLKRIVSNMENIYKEQAMMIVHWLASRLQETPLFNESEPISRPKSQKKFALSSRKRTWDVEESSLNESILTEPSIELAHLDVYEQNRATDVPPYRLVTYDIDSQAYHRAVYYCLTGEIERNLNLSGHDLRKLFETRRKYEWAGKDSLYDAWLILMDQCRPKFNLKLFEERNPGWRELKKQFNLETLTMKREEMFTANVVVNDVIVLSD